MDPQITLESNIQTNKIVSKYEIRKVQNPYESQSIIKSDFQTTNLNSWRLDNCTQI